jgi:hypothetical protein
MKNSNISFILGIGMALCTSSALAKSFECTSEQLTLRGIISVSGNLSQVTLDLVDKDDKVGHHLIGVAGPIQASSTFHPKSEKMKGFNRYVLSRDKGDSFQLFLPENAANGFQTAFAKIAFEDTYPQLEQLNCRGEP